MTQHCPGVQVPSMHELQGAVMVADITGFTKLTERLSKQGTAGVELLTKCICNYFTRVRSFAFMPMVIVQHAKSGVEQSCSCLADPCTLLLHTRLHAQAHAQHLSLQTAGLGHDICSEAVQH